MFREKKSIQCETGAQLVGRRKLKKEDIIRIYSLLSSDWEDMLAPVKVLVTGVRAERIQH